MTHPNDSPPPDVAGNSSRAPEESAALTNRPNEDSNEELVRRTREMIVMVQPVLEELADDPSK